MSHRAWTDIGVTAIFTAIILIGATLSSPLGAGDDPATPASAASLTRLLAQPPELAGCLITATVQPTPAKQGIIADLWQRLRGKANTGGLSLKLRVTKRAWDGTQFPFAHTLERVTMNPMSRVMSASDKEVIWSMGVTALFSGSETWEEDIEIPLPSATAQPATPEGPPSGPRPMARVTSYELTATHGEQTVLLAGFTPDQFSQAKAVPEAAGSQ